MDVFKETSAGKWIYSKEKNEDVEADVEDPGYLFDLNSYLPDQENAKKITGVRQSGGKREPTFIDVLHSDAVRLLHGTPTGVPDRPADPQSERPYIQNYDDDVFREERWKEMRMERAWMKEQKRLKKQEELKNMLENGPRRKLTMEELELYFTRGIVPRTHPGNIPDEVHQGAEGTGTKNKKTEETSVVLVPEYEDAGQFEDL